MHIYRYTLTIFTQLHVTNFPAFRFNPVALRKAKIVYNFGLSECNKVKITVLGVSYLSVCSSAYPDQTALRHFVC